MNLAPPAASLTSQRRPATTELLGDFLTLAAATVLLQVAFPDRIDLVAHVIGGAGVSLVVAAASSRWFRRWNPAISVGVCLVLAVLVELLQPGVVDFGDVAYTGAGALLLARSTTVVAHAGRRRQVAGGLLGVAMVAAGLAYRYGH